MAETNVQVNPSEVLNTVGSIVSLFDRPQHMKNVKPEESPVQRFMEAKENMPISQDGGDAPEPDVGDDYDDLG